MSQAAVSTRRFGGLDGLRAIAVGMVLVYHFFPGALRGGFLGVDVFFAISGFLITSLLLRELDEHGRLRLWSFWRRRARRLLPALGLVLLVCTSLAWAVGGDLLVGIRSQVAGAALFVSNWVFVANGTDYFAQDNAELFRNTWSLSIEEQFYLLLPLLLIVAFRFKRRAARSAPFLVLGVSSAVLMVLMSFVGAEATRIYFGSDTHAFGLLLGSALACLAHPDTAKRAGAGQDGAEQDRAERTGIGLGMQAVTVMVAVAGLGALGLLAALLPEASPESFRGGFQLATAAALAVVWAVTRPGAWVGKALDAAPLRWLGERSYGIYLWHWPVLLLLFGVHGSRSAAPVPEWVVGALALPLTFGAAILSYRYIEQPVRRMGLRRSLRALIAPRKDSRRQLAVAWAVAALLLVSVPATAVAIANAPSQTSAAAAIKRGQDALDTRTGEATESPSEETEPPEGAEAEAGDSDEASEPFAVRGGDITAVGDSVMLASLPELDETFPGIDVDAAVSRGLNAGVGVVEARAEQGALRGVVVVGLGTNGPVSAEELEALRQAAGQRPLVLVNAHGARDWIPGVNQTLADYADAHRGVVLADWDAAIAPAPDALAGDGIHPEPAGGTVYAESVRRALQELEQPGEGIGYSTPRR